MRLVSCLLLEITVGLTAFGAAAVGVWLGVTALSASLIQHEAAAATQVREHQVAAVEVPKPMMVEPAAVLLIPNSTSQSDVERRVFGLSDADALAPMRNSSVTAIKLNRGGTSLSIRVDFASGARASFKPQQIHDQSDPRREIAAFRLDRLLGIGHVPAAISAAFPLADLIAAAAPAARGVVSRRLMEEAKPQVLGLEQPTLYGEISWWVPEIVNAKLGTWRIDENDGIDLWRDELRPSKPLTEATADVVAQISKMIVFDFLIDNADRWTGSNTKSSPDGKLLYFMDNTLSFSKFTRGHLKNRTYLQRAGRFSRDLVQRLRTLTPVQIDEAMSARDVDQHLGRLLSEVEVSALMNRRDFVISYIDELIATYGESNVLVFP